MTKRQRTQWHYDYASRFMPSGAEILATLSSNSPVFSGFHHNFKDCNPEVVQGVVRAVKMASFWFLCTPVCDVNAISVDADMMGVI